MYRTKTGGLINRKEVLNFSFNGKILKGFEGDTLSSALLGNGIHLVGRSFKYHRPRGIFTSGSEEPSALVQLDEKKFTEPNIRATTVKLFDGLVANSQNHFGSLSWDFMRINDYLSNFLSAGFYYKTFMWPKAFWEKVYEPIIRNAAGLGKLSKEPDPSTYDKGFLHCDLLVIGAGPSGLYSALIAARTGAKVIIVDEDFTLGGSLNGEKLEINGGLCTDWLGTILSELTSFKNVRLMPKTTLYGSFDHGIYGALEIRNFNSRDNLKKPRHILWKIYSKFSVLCTGALERSILFENNDLPGIMLSKSMRHYCNRWGVIPGQHISIYTNNDDGWETAKDLKEAGCNVICIIDQRPDINPPIKNIDYVLGRKIAKAYGNLRISSIKLDNGKIIKTDCLAVSGGFNPNIHLTCHQRGRPKWNELNHCFIPNNPPKNMSVIGAANGIFNYQDIFKDSKIKLTKILQNLGHKKVSIEEVKISNRVYKVSPFPKNIPEGKVWVDLQNDVTVKDIKLAVHEGFHSVELLKRYTTLGMATDQGKNSNVLGLSILSVIKNKPMDEVGTTIFRPPFTPVPIGAFAGRSRGKHFKPFRLTPSHNWAKSNNAVFVEAGNWLRAQWFPLKGEKTWRESVDREVIQTRTNVGICDVTTLGKIDIKGKDAGAFLNFVYANNFGKLPIGKVRYGLMLRDDGIAFDDGTTARFSENHFVMTTTTANAVTVFRHLEFCKQCLNPDWDVHLISTTDHWAQFAVAGPKSRKLLQEICDPKIDISNDKFPFMACGEINVLKGIPARLFRISFSGELAYEIAIPRRYADFFIKEISEIGKKYNLVPYGTEALGVMRIEKGHAAGNELNGQTTANNLGLGKMVSKLNDCIGNTMSEREELNKENTLKLVGFIPTNKNQSLVAGSHFIEKGQTENLENDQGWMSSVAFSPMLKHSIGLGYIIRGNQRYGEKVHAVNPLRKEIIEVEIHSPHFYDPEGELLRG